MANTSPISAVLDVLFDTIGQIESLDPFLKQADPSSPYAIPKGKLTFPEISMTFEQIAALNEMHFESHETVTQDGYIVSLFRIYDPKHYKVGNPAVFLMHGI